MAVVRLADYFPRLRTRALGIAIALEVFLVGGGAVVASSFMDGTTIEELAVLLPLVVTSLISSIGSTVYALRPAKVMANAVTHVSGQQNVVTPPNVNHHYDEVSGLKSIVQTVYDLAIATPGQQTTSDSSVSSDFTHSLLGELPIGVIALDKDRHVIYANKLAPVRTDPKGVMGYELVFDVGSGITEWLDESESKVKATNAWQRVANTLPDEKDRRIFDVFAYYQKAGSAAETVIVTVDRTTDYAPAQEDMDFIALAAHELRGPITIIRGYLDVLTGELKPKLEGDQLELMERLSVSANRLSSYVNNILNVSRYDRRHLKLHLNEEHLDAIVRSVIDDVSMRARTQNRLLSIDIPSGLPTIAADQGSLSEVITNLIDNAIKYSNEGGQVRVTAKVSGGFVELNVVDQGIGIPGSVIGNLFTKFYRSHRSRSTVSGTGLGLYLSRAIIESHGGHIGVSSREGEGSTFTITLPIYSTVAAKLAAGNNGNQAIIETTSGWIKNHSVIKG